MDANNDVDLFTLLAAPMTAEENERIAKAAADAAAWRARDAAYASAHDVRAENLAIAAARRPPWNRYF